MPTNQQIINKAGTAIQTGSLTHGLLQPEQARKFIQQTFEATNLGPLAVSYTHLTLPTKRIV